MLLTPQQLHSEPSLGGAAWVMPSALLLCFCGGSVFVLGTMAMIAPLSSEKAVLGDRQCGYAPAPTTGLSEPSMVAASGVGWVVSSVCCYHSCWLCFALFSFSSFLPDSLESFQLIFQLFFFPFLMLFFYFFFLASSLVSWLCICFVLVSIAVSFARPNHLAAFPMCTYLCLVSRDHIISPSL